jgi:hypothetical protein
LRSALSQAAWGARRTKGSYFKAFYRRLAARKGKKRAIIAVAHALLVTGYVLVWTGKTIADLGENYFDALDQHWLTKRLVRRLEKLGIASLSSPRPDPNPGNLLPGRWSTTRFSGEVDRDGAPRLRRLCIF